MTALGAKTNTEMEKKENYSKNQLRETAKTSPLQSVAKNC